MQDENAAAPTEQTPAEDGHVTQSEDSPQEGNRPQSEPPAQEEGAVGGSEAQTLAVGGDAKEPETKSPPDMTTESPSGDFAGQIQEEVVTIDGIPVLEDITEEAEEEAGEEEGAEKKQELLEKILDAIEERNRMQTLNEQVQSEIAEFLARKKVPEPVYNSYVLG